MIVNIDVFTNNVSPNGLYSVNLPDSFSLSKTVEEDGEIKTVNFSKNPYIFTLQEIINQKTKLIMKENNYYRCYNDEFINEDDIDFTYDKHLCNTGVKILEFLPYGECQLKPIQLSNEVKSFKLYLEADSNISVLISGDGISFVEFVDGFATLTELTQEVILRFKNNIDKKQNVNFYCLMY